MWNYSAFCCFPPRCIQYIVTEYILYVLDTVLEIRDSMAKRVPWFHGVHNGMTHTTHYSVTFFLLKICNVREKFQMINAAISPSRR